MASALENIALLDRYFTAGGDLSFEASQLPVTRAMRELMADAKWDRGARRLFAQASIFERTLNPPSIVQSIFVRPALQHEMLAPLYDSLTGGFWTPPAASGITEWIGSEAGGRAYFVATLNSPPRVGDYGTEGRYEIELDVEVLAILLRITRDAALPVAWFEPLQANEVFRKLEARISSGYASQAPRRALLALNAQAAARVGSELAKLATAKLDAFPAFLPGDGRPTPTVPPMPKPLYRNGWAWIGLGAGAIGGGMLAARR